MNLCLITYGSCSNSFNVLKILIKSFLHAAHVPTQVFLNHQKNWEFIQNGILTLRTDACHIYVYFKFIFMRFPSKSYDFPSESMKN